MAAAAPQAKKDWNEWPVWGGVYNSVEVTGIEGKKFIEQGGGSTASYALGPHLGAETHGANSRRDGNFGVELTGTGTQTYNYDSFKGATWDLATQTKVGGKGTKTLSMHNWAFSNIEVSESFSVVDGVISAAPGAFSGDVHGMDQKMPIVLTGEHVTQKVVFGEVFKASSGWSIGREVSDSTTLTRSMNFGLSATLENAAKDKASGELGLSSTNVNTVWSKISTMGGATASGSASVSGETTVTGVKGKTVRKYVYPIYAVKNFKVTAYPHDPKTAEVTGGPASFTATFITLKKVDTVDANNEDGAVDAEHKPSAAQNAEDARLAEEKAGKEVNDHGGVKMKVALENEKDAQKDYDKQDFSAVLTEGDKSRVVTKEWASEVTNQFNVTNAGGQKVSGQGGWSLGSAGSYAGIGVKLGYSEMEQAAGEFGDQVVETGSNGKAVNVKVSQEVTGPEKGSNKHIQVITMPLFRERVYSYSASDPATGSWQVLPAKARSRYYYPVGAVTTKDIPPKSELKPEGPQVLDDSKTDGAATQAKDLKSKIDAEPDPAKKAAMQKELEDTLVKNREAMEDSARRAHPSLEVIDRAKNVYEIELIVPVDDKDKAAGKTSQVKNKYRSTIEGLLNFTAPSVAAHNAADVLATHDTNPADGVSITATPALGGTGAQGSANPYPGDVDMSESIKIVAPTADGAATAMAFAIQATVTTATKPRADGKLGYSFHGCMVGVLPGDAKKPGAAAKFTATDTMAGQLTYAKKDGTKGTFTLAQAIASPASDRSVNTYWRGPIDEQGTYGEITKVLNYDAVTASGDHLFGTPKVGQSFQEVGFGGEGRHDTERAKLMTALGPQIAKYAADGDWVKAVKRAFTVARMLNDIAALNAFTPLLGSEVSELKQAADHVEMFANDVVNPKVDDKLKGGIGDGMTKEQAMAEAQMLAARLGGIDGAADTVPHVHKAIGMARDGDLRRNNPAYHELEDHVVKPLQQKIKGNHDFAKQAAAALASHGYLPGKAP